MGAGAGPVAAASAGVSGAVEDVPSVGYFPDLFEVPLPIVEHVRGALDQSPTWPTLAETLTTMLRTLRDGISPDGQPVTVTDGYLDW